MFVTNNKINKRKFGKISVVYYSNDDLKKGVFTELLF